MEEKLDKILPQHYKADKGLDTIAFCLANDLGFSEGNVVKYVVRHKQKNGVEDLLKAQEYLKRLIQSYEMEK